MKTQPVLSALLVITSSLPTVAADLLVPTDYASIQEAVDASSSGDTIHIAARDYYEQIVMVDKTNLTLRGEPGAVIHATTTMIQTLRQYGVGSVPILGILRSHVVVTGLAFEGNRLGSYYNSLWLGLLFRGSSGAVRNCTVRGFRGPSLAQDVNARGINIVNPVSVGTPTVNVEVFNSMFEDNKISILASGDDANPSLLRTTFAFQSNIITGLGPTAAILGYGVAILTGAGGEVKANTITDHCHTGALNNYAAGIAANDGLFLMRGYFVPLQTIRYHGNVFSNNNVHLAAIAANEHELRNNVFQRTGPGSAQWALAISGTSIVMANNDFSDAPTGIMMFQGELSSGVSRGYTTAPRLVANWFCNVAEPIHSEPEAPDLQEQGTEFCPFRPTLQSIKKPAALTVRSWHG